MRKNKSAFTLVELIVVVVILSILGLIAFISMEDYSKSSRNTVRITDIGIIKQSLGIFEVETGKYPLPENIEEITYNGGLLWSQGTFGEKVRGNLDNLSVKPIDPLLDIEYDYSVINNKTKYQLGTIMEGGLFVENILISETNALNYGIIESYVTGNYDLFDIKSQNGTECSLLPIPSLFVNNQSSTGALFNSQDYYFVYDTGYNISTNYGQKVSTSGSGTAFVISEVLSKCSVDTLDELNLYISKLGLVYQQLLGTEDFDEIIYNFSVPTFKVGLIDNLISNGISVATDLKLKVLDPSAGNIFSDTFTGNNNTNLVGTHIPDTFGEWTKTGALINDSYIISGNKLLKNDNLTGAVFSKPVLPITSRDKTILFNIKDFSGGSIFAYVNYVDANNYYGVELTPTGYNIINMVGGIQPGIYPINLSESIPLNSLIEFNVTGNNIKLSINNIEKDNLIDSIANLTGAPAINITNSGGGIDNFILIYK